LRLLALVVHPQDASSDAASSHAQQPCLGPLESARGRPAFNLIRRCRKCRLSFDVMG
jgi:hypothetical protein